MPINKQEELESNLGKIVDKYLVPRIIKKRELFALRWGMFGELETYYKNVMAQSNEWWNQKLANTKEEAKQLIAIEWIDASISNNDTFTQEEAEEEKLIHGFAVGVLVKEFKDRYVIARDWFDGFDTYRGVASYPKTGIVKVKKYNFAKEK